MGFSVDFKGHAHRSWVLHPEEANTIRPALFFPDDLKKVSALADGTTLEVETARMNGGQGSHTATTAYELSDVVLSSGQVFTSKVHYPITANRAPLFPRGSMIELNHAVLVSTPYGIRYFGHWTLDDLPLVIAAREIGVPIAVSTQLTSAQLGYLDLLGLGTSTATDAYFKKLIVIDDVGKNSYKQRRFGHIRAKGARYAGSTSPAGVMLLRGTGGSKRLLVNEAEVADLARSRGLVVLDPALTEPAEVIRRCWGARIVLGVEGSQLTNGMLWMSEQGIMVVIQPPDRFSLVLKNTCDCIGIRTAFVVGASESGGFRADIDGLTRMLDLVGAQVP